MLSAGLVCTATWAGRLPALAKWCTVPGGIRTVSPGPQSPADPEPHLPREHGEALLLLGVGIAARDAPDGASQVVCCGSGRHARCLAYVLLATGGAALGRLRDHRA